MPTYNVVVKKNCFLNFIVEADTKEIAQNIVWTQLRQTNDHKWVENPRLYISANVTDSTILRFKPPE
jgi:hypothetical protein